jgi:F-type H+-transporting ATPase subunit alpha
VEDVRRFENELLEWFRTRHADILDGIKASGDIADVEAFETALKGFADSFEPAGGRPADEPGAEAQGDEERAMAGGRAEAILPEEEITRDDAEGGAH